MTGAGAVRLGIVGCGRLAERGYLPALASVDGARLVAVADPSAERRAVVVETASGLLGQDVAGYDGVGALLAEGGGELDAVLIASPVGSHVADARAVAAAGLAALVEKPPAPDLAGAVELAKLAPCPWLGFNRRFDPGARALRSAVPADGEVDLLLRLSYRRPSWGAHTVRDDALLDLGPHLLDWARWLTGRAIVDVACPTLTTERAVLELTLDRGRARLEASTDRPHEELIELRDGSGRLLARHRTGGLAAALRARLLGRGPDALVTSLQGELTALVAALRSDAASSHGTPAAPGPDTPDNPGPPAAPGAPSDLSTPTDHGHTTDSGTPTDHGRTTDSGTLADRGRSARSTGTALPAESGSSAGLGTPARRGRLAGAGTSTDLGTPADGVAVMAGIAAARDSAGEGGRPVSLRFEEHS